MRKEWVKPIQFVLRKRQHRVKLTQVWRSIEAEYAVGVMGRNHLDLRDADFDRLQTILASFLKHGSPLSIDLTADRITLASQTPQEKISPVRALSMVRLAPTDGYVSVFEMGTENRYKMRVLPGTVLSVSLNQLALEADYYQNIIIVENGAIIERWWSIVALLPEELRTGTLFVYRGHGDEQKRLLQRLAQLQDERTKIYFFGDFDPSGIYIALTSIARRIPSMPFGIIAPSSPEELSQKMSKPDVFLRQGKHLSSLESKVSLAPPVQTLVKRLRVQGLAVTQETLIAQQVGLRAYMAMNYE